MINCLLPSQRDQKATDQAIQRILSNLSLFKEKMIDLKTQMNQKIDRILQIIDQQTIEVNGAISSDGNETSSLQWQKPHLIHEMCKEFLIKMYSSFQKLLKIDEIKECYENLQELTIKIQNVSSQLCNQHPKLELNRIKTPKNLTKISHKLINQVTSSGCCWAFAFNNLGNILISGKQDKIKVWDFKNGKIKKLAKLQSSNIITCLIFHSNNQQFFSGDEQGNIFSWKIGSNNSEWIKKEPNKQHNQLICQILLNNQDELISCSRDSRIIVWKSIYEDNKIEYLYTLSQRHQSAISSITLNESENALVSCSDIQIILWLKGSLGKWIYNHHISMDQRISRICFFNDFQIIVQQQNSMILEIIEIEEYWLKVINQNLQLPKQSGNNDEFQFPTIFNKNKDIIVQKSGSQIYIIREQNDGKLKIEANIQCNNNFAFGALSESGEYLVTWNTYSQDIKIYKLLFN